MIAIISLCVTCVVTGFTATWYLATKIEHLATSKADKDEVNELSERIAVLETKMDQ